MSRFLSFVLLLLFKFLLDITYIKFVHPLYSFYFPLEITGIKIIESYILMVILFLFINSWLEKLKRPSYITVYMLYLNLIIPLLSYYGLSNQSRGFVYMACFSLFIVLFIVKFFKLIFIFSLKEAKVIFIFSIIIISFYVYAYLILTGGLGRLNFDISNVYDTRDLYGQSTNFVMGYFLPWQGYTVNIVLLSYALFKKKRLMVTFVIIGQILLFGMTGFKSMLFAPILVVALHFFLNIKKMNKLFFFLITGSVLLMVYSILMFFVKGDIIAPSLFIRRLFFIPAQLHFVYHDFFQNHPFVYLSDSIFSSFVKYPYGLTNIKFVISNHFFDHDMGINVGYIANAYMNFGYLGIFVFSVLLGLVLKFLDSISAKLPLSVATSAIIVPSTNFVNSGLLTVLLTGGFLFAMLLLWLMRGWINKTDKKLTSNSIVKTITP